MDTSDVATVFAVTILTGYLVLIVAVASPTLRPRVTAASLWLAAFVAVSATLGSLYFSEVADFVPCRLCWFQRIAMYPLAVLLPIAAIRRDRAAAVYVLPLAAIGALISGYHVREQLFPAASTACELDNPCSAKWVEVIGWMTIPMMAGLSFLAIVVFCWLMRRGRSALVATIG